MTLLWSHGGELCFVPDLREFLDGQGVQRRGFLTASFDDQCSWFHDGEPIRTRLDADLEYINGLHSVENEEYVPSLQRLTQIGVLKHLESGSVRSDWRSVGCWKARLERHEPILIHGADKSLEERFPSFQNYPKIHSCP